MRIKRSPNQSHSGELASGTPLGTAEKLPVICSLKSSVTAIRTLGRPLCSGAIVEGQAGEEGVYSAYTSTVHH